MVIANAGSMNACTAMSAVSAAASSAQMTVLSSSCVPPDANSIEFERLSVAGEGLNLGDGAYAIGMDLGGTNLKGASIDMDGNIIDRFSVPVDDDKSPQGLLDLISGKIRALARERGRDPVGVGCGIPGIIDAKTGIVHAVPQLPLWTEVPMRDMLSAKIGRPVATDNDANMAALGEFLNGAGKGSENMVMFTLGTGLGAGIIIGGDIYTGDFGTAGEIGHIVLEPRGVDCNCFGQGCFERYASSTAFNQFYREMSPDQWAKLTARMLKRGFSELTPEIVAQLADEGFEPAKMMWEWFGTNLGAGIVSTMNTLGIMTFVLGGGITKSWDRFEEPMMARARRTFPHHASKLNVVPAKLGDDAGATGAAMQSIRLAGIGK